jgi:hypothetical protein
MKGNNLITRVFRFYYEGFAAMTVGKKLWIIILLKLFIMFGLLKVFFFPDILEEKFDTDEERSEYVIEQLSKPKKIDDND